MTDHPNDTSWDDVPEMTEEELREQAELGACLHCQALLTALGWAHAGPDRWRPPGAAEGGLTLDGAVEEQLQRTQEQPCGEMHEDLPRIARVTQEPVTCGKCGAVAYPPKEKT